MVLRQIPLIAAVMSFTAVLFSQGSIQSQVVCRIWLSCLFNLEQFLGLPLMFSNFLKNMGQLLGRMSFSLGLSNLPHDYIQVVPCWQEFHRSGTRSFLERQMRRHMILVCLNTTEIDLDCWFKQCLLDFSTVKILFFFSNE